MSVRIPADVDRPDRVLGPLTARQLAILGITGIALYAGYIAVRSVMPAIAYVVLAIPIAAVAASLALGQRDGVSLDRLVFAALRQRLTPTLWVAAPEGIHPVPEWLATRINRQPETGKTLTAAPLQLPAEGVTETGVIDLGRDGLAVLAACSTVNFSLRTNAEQEALVSAFGRYLHSLTAPVQVLIRAQRLDLSTQISELRECAPALPHPALESAAREHADYLAQLAQSDLLRRQILLVLREPVPVTGTADRIGSRSPVSALLAKRKAAHPLADETTRHTAETQLARRLAEATELLAPAGITVTGLDAGQTTAVLASASNPDSLVSPNSRLAGADDIITTPAIGYGDVPYDAGNGHLEPGESACA